MPQRVGDQGRLLGGMALGKAGRRRSGGGAAGIARRACRLSPASARHSSSTVLDEVPGAIVLRLFLRPDQLFQLGHRLQPLDQRLAREGIELLDADDLGASCRRPRRALPSARRRACPSTARARRVSPAAGGLRSHRMRRKWPSPVKSSRVDTASLCRSSDLGVIITSGLRKSRSIWRRRMWK